MTANSCWRLGTGQNMGYFPKVCKPEKLVGRKKAMMRRMHILGTLSKRDLVRSEVCEEVYSKSLKGCQAMKIFE